MIPIIDIEKIQQNTAKALQNKFEEETLIEAIDKVEKTSKEGFWESSNLAVKCEYQQGFDYYTPEEIKAMQQFFASNGFATRLEKELLIVSWRQK